MSTTSTFVSTRRDELARGILWASSLVLALLIAVQVGRSGAGNQALAAGVQAEVGAIKVLSMDASSNEDVVLVLNELDETISVYAVDGARSLELYQSLSLPEIFGDARSGVKPGGRR